MFQSFYGLPQTGRLDEATVDLMKRGRCGVADIPEDDDNTRVARSTDSESPQSINYGGEKQFLFNGLLFFILLLFFCLLFVLDYVFLSFVLYFIILNLSLKG